MMYILLVCYHCIEWQLPRTLFPDSYFEDDLDLEMDDDELLNTTAEIERQYMDKQEIERQYMDKQANSSGLTIFW